MKLQRGQSLESRHFMQGNTAKAEVEKSSRHSGQDKQGSLSAFWLQVHLKWEAKLERRTGPDRKSFKCHPEVCRLLLKVVHSLEALKSPKPESVKASGMREAIFYLNINF